MKIELNYREYVYVPCSTKFPKCDICKWKKVPVSYCTQFCRAKHILKKARIAPSIFHL